MNPPICETEPNVGSSANRLLTRVQTQLRERIADAVQRAGHAQIEYRSEWLGYLPYGCYHWITCNGADIDLVLSEDWSVSDLIALERAGFLKKIDEWTNPDNEFDTTISYCVCDTWLPEPVVFRKKDNSEKLELLELIVYAVIFASSIVWLLVLRGVLGLPIWRAIALAVCLGPVSVMLGLWLIHAFPSVLERGQTE